MNSVLRILVVLAAGSLCAQAQEKRGDWPQWRGPERTNVSTETGLLSSWPESGPPLELEVIGIGGGIAAPAVAADRIYTVGYFGDGEYLSALDATKGTRLWASRIGPAVQESPLMRWLGQRMPTVDGDRVYAFHSQGQLVCFDSATGKELWRKNYVKEFEAQTHQWGLCDRPLVDGENLIITPGGRIASMAALKKTTGDLVWKSEPKGSAAHAATVVSTAAGVRQYVTCLAGKVVSFRASDGKHLWTHDDFGRIANSCTPIALGDDLIATAGYGVGLTLLKLSSCGDIVQATPQYAERVDVSPFQDSALVVGGHLYLVGGSARSCVDLSTGKVVWTDRSTGRGLAAMTYAEGRLYVHHSEGTLALAEATPQKLTVTSTFKVSPWRQASGASNPVLAGGRLYVRNEQRLLAFDVREGATKGERQRPKSIVLESPVGKAVTPDQAVYVPTPHDVVEKMLEMAKVTEDDTVYDLGSGDGRIVVSAAKKHGARAVGYEIDPQLVREARANIEKAGVKDLASIEAIDLFNADVDKANVLALYLPEKYLERMMPLFDKLGCGARIVSHQFKIPGVKPDQTLQMQSKEDGDVHTIYLWQTPLTKEGK